MKDRYLHYEKAGDQFVGRMVCGHNVGSIDFAVSPPHFKYDSDNDQQTILSVIEESCSSMKTNLKPVALFCVASILYHYKFLEEKLGSKCELWASPIFMDDLTEMKEKAIISYPWDDDKWCPRITGVPPHVCIMSQMEKLSRNQKEIPNGLRQALVSELDKRGTNGLSIDRINQLLDKHFAEMAGKLNDMSSRISDYPENRSYPSGSVQVHHYGGKFHRLPNNFKLPEMSFSTLLVHWVRPDLERNIPTLDSLSHHDIEA